MDQRKGTLGLDGMYIGQLALRLQPEGLEHPIHKEIQGDLRLHGVAVGDPAVDLHLAAGVRMVVDAVLVPVFRIFLPQKIQMQPRRVPCRLIRLRHGGRRGGIQTHHIGLLRSRGQRLHRGTGWFRRHLRGCRGRNGAGGERQEQGQKQRRKAFFHDCSSPSGFTSSTWAS